VTWHPGRIYPLSILRLLDSTSSLPASSSILAIPNQHLFNCRLFHTQTSVLLPHLLNVFLEYRLSRRPRSSLDTFITPHSETTSTVIMSSPRRRIETDVSSTAFQKLCRNVANINCQQGHEVRCRLCPLACGIANMITGCMGPNIKLPFL